MASRAARLIEENDHLRRRIEALQTAVDNKTNKNVQVTVSDGTNTDTYDFAIVPLSWVVNGGPEEKGTMSFTLKISGAITKS